MAKLRLLGARTVLAHSKGVMRLTEVVDAAPTPEWAVRDELAHLEERGEVDLFQVGDHEMVKAVGDLREETKNRSGPRSDKSHGRTPRLD